MPGIDRDAEYQARIDQRIQGNGSVAAVNSTVHYIVNQCGQPVQAAPVTPEALAVMKARLAELPLDVLPSITTVPAGSRLKYSPNTCFVGREEDLKELARYLKVGKTVIATGMGGIGKTQIAAEFVHRYGTYFPGGVFWLSFGNPDNIPNEIAQCGYGMNLRLDYGDLKLEDQVRTVRSAWAIEAPRLLIFDNCEDETLLRAFRPVSGGASILVTSRREEWDRSLGIEAIALGVLSSDESVALLRKLNTVLSESADKVLREISSEVGSLPLALHLVGSYMYTYRRIISPEQVLGELRHYENLEQKALKGEFGTEPIALPTAHERNVWRTFQMSYSKLNKKQATDKLALRLLTCSACFALGESIPLPLLSGAVLSKDPSQEKHQQVEDALARLTGIGLLETASQEPPAYRLHRLIGTYVRVVNRDGLSKAREGVEGIALSEARQVNNSGLVQPLAGWLVHLRHVTDEAVRIESDHTASLCNELGNYLYRIADYVGARARFEQALVIDEAAFGPQHPHFVRDTNNLGMVLYALGNYADAKACYEQVLSIVEGVWGPYHPYVASVANNLGLVLKDMGDYMRAKACFEQALDIDGTVFGLQHPNVATVANNLGMVLCILGDYGRARECHEQALAIAEGIFGTQHPTVAIIASNLGTVLHELGDYAGAKVYFEQALAIEEAVFGSQHPSVATELNNLGSVLHALGDYTGAKVRIEQALSIDEIVFSPSHPAVATYASNLGGVLQDMGDYVGARIRYEQALAIAETIFGLQHPSVATYANNLGLVLREQGDYIGAKVYIERALAIDKAVFGTKHSEVAIIANNLGGVMQSVGDYAGAKMQYEQALAIAGTIFGLQHPTVATYANNLASVLLDLGDYMGAKARYEQALEILETKLGPEHPNAREIRDNLNALLGTVPEDTADAS